MNQQNLFLTKDQLNKYLVVETIRKEDYENLVENFSQNR